MSDGSWQVDDLLGAPYRTETIPLGHDDEGTIECTLVHRPADEPTTRAVLHVHGFCDYFFHDEYAAWWNERGHDFYAVDLRRCGRSLRPHQAAGYVADLADYYADLDACWQRITERDHHDHVLLSAHSTGGLTGSLWAHDRTPEYLEGLVLNSPWFDMHGPFWMRIGSTVMRQVGGYQPRREVPRGAPGFYARSIHASLEGEWDYDLSLKPRESWPIFAGWLRAIRLGHARLHGGLDLDVPVLVLTSGSTARPTEMGEDVFTHDVVLDVEHMRRWAPQVARHLTLVSVEGAIHDVVLSRPDVRARIYDELGRWLDSRAVARIAPGAASEE